MLRLPMRDRLLSWLRPRVLARSNSPVNPFLEVVEDSGRRLLNSATSNYSFGGLYDAFNRAFYYFDLRGQVFNRVLILGFGAGSIVELIMYHPQLNIVGVELDSEVIRLYKMYFHHFDSVRLVCAEAKAYLELDSSTYDLILVDVFIDRKNPPHLLGRSFLELLALHLTSEGIVLFNRIDESESEQTRQAFEDVFAATMGQMRTFRTGINTFYCNR